jgi:hypothetical protein
MAYGELGGLLPRVTSFSSPEAYTEAAKAEAHKKASYLAQMDQFFTQLQEATRQFDLTLEFQQKSFDETMAYQHEQLDWQKLYQQGLLDLQGDQNDLTRTQIGNEAKYQSGQLSLAQQRLNFDMNQAAGEDDLVTSLMPYLQNIYGASGRNSGSSRTSGFSMSDLLNPSNYGQMLSGTDAGGNWVGFSF